MIISCYLLEERGEVEVTVAKGLPCHRVSTDKKAGDILVKFRKNKIKN